MSRGPGQTCPVSGGCQWFLFWNGYHCGPGWPWTHRSLPSLASWVLRWQICVASCWGGFYLFVLGEKQEKNKAFFLGFLSEAVLRNRVVHSHSNLCCGKESVPIALDSGAEGADSAGVEGETGSGLDHQWSWVETRGQQISFEGQEAKEVWSCVWPEQHRWTWRGSSVCFTPGIQRLSVCTCAVTPAAEAHT